jgi:hypothetical protein
MNRRRMIVAATSLVSLLCVVSAIASMGGLGKSRGRG